VKDFNEMTKTIVAFAVCVAAISTPVLAQEAGGRGGWGQRDQTRAEAQQRADMIFQMIDANRDGTVTRAEAEQAAAQFAARGGGEGRGGGRMQRLIDQAFGTAQSLTLQQFEGLMLQRFDAQDLNHDGILTAAEREQGREQRGAAPAPAAPGAPATIPQPPRQ
jgi:hypothetical protein